MGYKQFHSLVIEKSKLFSVLRENLSIRREENVGDFCVTIEMAKIKINFKVFPNVRNW